MKKVPCYCDNIMDLDLKDNIDLGKNPEIEANILDGTFMSIKCDKCGKILKPEFPVRVYNDKKNIDLFLIPEIERNMYLLGKKQYNSKKVVIGYPELIEKIKLKNDNLDDRVIEIIKYYLLNKLETEKDIFIFYNEIKDSTLIFHIYGLKKEEIGISRIESSYYDKVKKSLKDKLKEDPFSEILSLPYISVNKMINREF